MSILVKTQNKDEEKVLLAFLDSLQYQYEFEIDDLEKVKLYNLEIENSDNEIENGNFILHDEVEAILKNRKNKLNEN